MSSLLSHIHPPFLTLPHTLSLIHTHAQVLPTLLLRFVEQQKVRVLNIVIHVSRERRSQEMRRPGVNVCFKRGVRECVCVCECTLCNQKHIYGLNASASLSIVICCNSFVTEKAQIALWATVFLSKCTGIKIGLTLTQKRNRTESSVCWCLSRGGEWISVSCQSCHRTARFSVSQNSQDTVHLNVLG